MARISEAALKRQAHSCGLPTILDDIDMSKEMRVRIIDHYTGTGGADAKASYSVRSGLMISSNSSIRDEPDR